MKTKIKDIYNYKFRSYTKNTYTNNEFGFKGIYTHRDLGKCEVYLIQDMGGNNNYLGLDIWYNGIEYIRRIILNQKCTYRYAGLQALKFLKETILR